MDITVHREQISVLSDQAKQFVSAGHFDTAAIQERQEMMEARYQGLQVCVCVCVCVCVHVCMHVCVCVSTIHVNIIFSAHEHDRIR